MKKIAEAALTELNNGNNLALDRHTDKQRLNAKRGRGQHADTCRRLHRRDGRRRRYEKRIFSAQRPLL